MPVLLALLLSLLHTHKHPKKRMQCASLQKELDSIQQQLQRVDRLLHIADPEGWYKPKEGAGTAAAAAAAAAKAAAKAAIEEERQRRAAAVAAQRAAQQAAQVRVLVGTVAGMWQVQW
jgi:hypothetical protein